ncbi:MAG TPA: HAD-IA family hydrolase [Burkholderiales bacterium]|nr:HAD-IA family hydrolase [Burkholderiales bacterium]
MTLEALIFDLDGTMADTEEVHRQAFNAAFIKLDLWWDWGPLRYSELLEVSSGVERLRRYVDSLEVAPAEKARLHALVPVIHFVKSEIYLDLLRNWRPPLRPGVKRLVGEAHEQGLQVAVVTTSATANARAVLDNHFKGEIALLVCADEVPRKKPAPDIYLRALSLLRKSATACVALEDSANGLRAARAAGLATIVTPSRWTMAQDFAGADLLRPDLEAIGLEDVRRLHHAARRAAA